MQKKVSHFVSLIPGAQLPMRYLRAVWKKLGLALTFSYPFKCFLADKLWTEPKISEKGNPPGDLFVCLFVFHRERSFHVPNLESALGKGHSFKGETLDLARRIHFDTWRTIVLRCLPLTAFYLGFYQRGTF